MSSGELLGIDPKELRFPFESDKQISCILHLSNKTKKNVAFKLKTTNRKKYAVRPNVGIVRPQSSCDVIVTMQAQKKSLIETECKDKFLVQSIAITNEDVTSELFSKESGKRVHEFAMKVVYVPLRKQSFQKQSSQVRESSEMRSLREETHTDDEDVGLRRRRSRMCGLKSA